MCSHLCHTKHVRKASNLLDTQKVDGDDGSLMCSPLLLMAFFGRISLNVQNLIIDFCQLFYIAFGTLP